MRIVRGCNKNGIVLEARVMNGNTGDNERNGYAIDHVKKIQQAQKSSAPLLVDSKLICQEQSADLHNQPVSAGVQGTDNAGGRHPAVPGRQRS